ncbi:MAG: TolC family protein [Candidatus Accumulibacter sp.]|uniref:TolC family protein n=1 Tax=Accumulibacter sp. TaxID=2053492 RepID=UPI001A387F40|nr:TolC family protein [Accumulibacter sp.]MBL8395428.1 TolC family protein [Accumulibacter sp.]
MSYSTPPRRTRSNPGVGRHRLALATLLASLASELPAFDRSDPFATSAITPARPALTVERGPLPCQVLPADAAYGMVEVVDLALCQNPTTREVWAAARVRAAEVGLAQADFLPTVNGSVSASRLRIDSRSANQRNASLTLSWLLFDFGARSANLEVARELMNAAASTLDATVQSVFLNALQAYYNAQAARAAVSAALESEKASRESLTAAEVRYRIGNGTLADRLQAQTAWSQATLFRIRAEGVRQNSLGRLANVMGLDANRPLRLDEPPAARPEEHFADDLAALIAEARLRRPELKAAEAEFKAAEAGIDYARASGLPTLSLTTGPQWEDLGGASAHGNSVGLTLNLPLFSGFTTTYNVRAAQARSEVAAARRDNVRQQVALEVWEAWQNLNTATQTLHTSADLLASAEHSERVALGRYKAGVGTILDLLNAQSALANARLQRVQSALDWQVSRATLARALGALDGQLLALNLPQPDRR